MPICEICRKELRSRIEEIGGQIYHLACIEAAVQLVRLPGWFFVQKEKAWQYDELQS